MGAVAAAFVLFGFGLGGWTVATADVERAMGLHHGGFGAELSVALGAAAVVNAFVGALAERLGTPRVLAGGLVLWGGAWLTGSVADGWALRIAVVVLLAAGGAVDVVMNAAATGALADRPGALVQFHGLFNAGAAVGAVTVGLAGSGGWRGVWQVDGATAIVLGVLCWSAAIPGAGAGERVSLGASARAVLAAPILPIAIAFALGAMVEGGIETWGVLTLRTVLAVGLLAGAGAAGAGYLIAAGARFGLGPRAAAGGARTGVTIGAGAAAVGLTGLAATHRPGVAVAGLVLAMLGISMCWPLLLALAAGGSSRPAVVVGGVSAVGYLGFVVGPAVVGAVAGAGGLRAGLLVLAAGAALVAVAPMTVIAER
jgi:hypothetical protein